MLKKCWFVFVLFIMASTILGQDFGVGMEIYGFRVPDYDDDQVLRAQLYGAHAKVLEDGVVEITNLKIEMYQEGKVVMTIFSPHCFFNRETKKAYSTDRVLMESDLMTVVGNGFSWDAAAGSFQVLHKSKVLIKKAASANFEGLKL